MQTQLPRKSRVNPIHLFAAIVTLCLASGPAFAVDLTALGSIGGPLSTALSQLASLTAGMKALIGFLCFVACFVSLVALRGFAPVLSFIGVIIFGAVGLAVGGAILGVVA